jgi:hypothetical protein
VALLFPVFFSAFSHFFPSPSFTFTCHPCHSFTYPQTLFENFNNYMKDGPHCLAGPAQACHIFQSVGWDVKITFWQQI